MIRKENNLSAAGISSLNFPLDDGVNFIPSNIPNSSIAGTDGVDIAERSSCSSSVAVETRANENCSKTLNSSKLLRGQGTLYKANSPKKLLDCMSDQH